MSEFDRSSLDGFLSEEAKKQVARDGHINAIVGVLQESAAQVLVAYEAEKQELLPLAEEKLGAVIIPWWQDFKESGAYQRVFEYLSQDPFDFKRSINPVVSVADPIVFPWLRRVSTVPEDLKSRARFLLDNQAGEVEKAQEQAAAAFAPHDGWEHLWKANFYIAGENQFRHEPGFGISLWPLGGGGFAYAMVASRNDIPLQEIHAGQLITRVHPEVILGFADQIESGRVYQRLEQSLQPRSPQRAVPVSREDYRRSEEPLAHRYWERKQERRGR